MSLSKAGVPAGDTVFGGKAVVKPSSYESPMHQWVWPPPSMPEGAVTSVHPDVGAAATLASTVGTSGYADGLLGPGAGTAPQSWYAGVYVLTSAPRSVLLKPSVNEANVRLMLVPIALGEGPPPAIPPKVYQVPSHQP